MIHVSSSCTPTSMAPARTYINGDLSVFMQCIVNRRSSRTSRRSVRDSHGVGSALPLGPAIGGSRWRWAAGADRLPHGQHYFDTCVYHQPGMETLFRSVPMGQIIFASEMIGA